MLSERPQGTPPDLPIRRGGHLPVFGSELGDPSGLHGLDAGGPGRSLGLVLLPEFLGLPFLWGPFGRRNSPPFTTHQVPDFAGDSHFYLTYLDAPVPSVAAVSKCEVRELTHDAGWILVWGSRVNETAP